MRTGRTITSRTVTLRGTADLRAGLSTFGDEQLASLLGSASRLGIDDAELRRQAGVPLASAFHFRVAAALNGEATVHWTVPMGQSVPIRAESREWSWSTLASAVAVLIGLAGIGWLLRPSARRNPACGGRARSSRGEATAVTRWTWRSPRAWWGGLCTHKPSAMGVAFPVGLVATVFG